MIRLPDSLKAYCNIENLDCDSVQNELNREKSAVLDIFQAVDNLNNRLKLRIRVEPDTLPVWAVNWLARFPLHRNEPVPAAKLADALMSKATPN